jgi:hypothetical protein
MSSGKQLTPAQTRTYRLTHVACCKLPPVEAEYSPKGSYEKINGYKTYVTGPEDSDKAIVAIYDIFGFSPQILQGVSLVRGVTKANDKVPTSSPPLALGSTCPISSRANTPPQRCSLVPKSKFTYLSLA